MAHTVRQATIYDLDQLVPLFDSYRQFYGRESDRREAREFLLARFHNDESTVFIAYQGERAIGFTQLYPSFSSISLARIFILRPEVLIADEPTSMVDACSRASILDYLMKLKEELKMTIVFVTHDIGLAYYISDSIYIMHKGQIVEQGPPDQVTQSPTSDVTKQLLEDIPNVHHDWLHRGPPVRKAAS